MQMSFEIHTLYMLTFYKRMTFVNIVNDFKRKINVVRGSGRITERTLYEYKKYLDLYLIPFFGNICFNDFNTVLFEKFIVWARKRKLRGRSVGNKSINKYFVPLRMICDQRQL